jgi:hypothetical protein
MVAANIRTEAAIITSSGFTVDFADFAMALSPAASGEQISFSSWRQTRPKKRAAIA